MSRELKLTYEDPRVLVKNKWNPNKMSPEAESKLRNSIQKNGHVKPILVRELEDGSLEIVGGEHRVDVSIDLGLDRVPVVNLGQISDEEAKKALLIDNSRYGEDDAATLSALLEDIGSADELAEWTTYTTEQLKTLIGTIEAEDDEMSILDELASLEETDDEPLPAAVPEIQTHQTMKFKVPVEDAHIIKDFIDGIAKVQKLDDSDSAVRAGDALLWLVRDYKLRTSDVEDEDDTEYEPDGSPASDFAYEDEDIADFLSTLEPNQE